MTRYLTKLFLVVLAAALLSGCGDLNPFGDDDDADVANGNGDTVALGESIYSQQCAGCHSIDGSDGVGPTLDGLYGSEVTMDDGSTVVVDEEHLYEAITDPRASTREGFPDVMPPFSNLSDDEIDGLIAFIQSLE